ncbi:MAG: hypothetical protein RIC38_06045, partial [Chromatocurvus sp.]
MAQPAYQAQRLSNWAQTLCRSNAFGRAKSGAFNEALPAADHHFRTTRRAAPDWVSTDAPPKLPERVWWSAWQR